MTWEDSAIHCAHSQKKFSTVSSEWFCEVWMTQRFRLGLGAVNIHRCGYSLVVTDEECSLHKLAVQYCCLYVTSMSNKMQLKNFWRFRYSLRNNQATVQSLEHLNTRNPGRNSIFWPIFMSYTKCPKWYV